MAPSTTAYPVHEAETTCSHSGTFDSETGRGDEHHRAGGGEGLAAHLGQRPLGDVRAPELEQPGHQRLGEPVPSGTADDRETPRTEAAVVGHGGGRPRGSGPGTDRRAECRRGPVRPGGRPTPPRTSPPHGHPPSGVGTPGRTDVAASRAGSCPDRRGNRSTPVTPARRPGAAGAPSQPPLAAAVLLDPRVAVTVIWLLPPVQPDPHRLTRCVGLDGRGQLVGTGDRLALERGDHVPLLEARRCRPGLPPCTWSTTAPWVGSKLYSLRSWGVSVSRDTPRNAGPRRRPVADGLVPQGGQQLLDLVGRDGEPDVLGLGGARRRWRPPRCSCR